jgi:predicted metal-dependent HD superfamily phosphohydrolase
VTDLFVNSWDSAWSGLRASGRGHAVRDALLTRYAESHRRYHSVQHLEEGLSLFGEARAIAEQPASVEMALWFHDAIYDPKASDNELRSADWARAELTRAGVSPEVVSGIAELILVTRHTALPQSCDEQLLVDVDLAILGATDARFAEYERQIREEYAHVPELVFRTKRREILQMFLDRATIYCTARLRAELETRARANLARSIAGLGAR